MLRPAVLSFVLLPFLPSPARAGEVVIVGVAGSSLADAALVGAGGELYRRSGTTWKRTSEGGTAATLAAARGSATEVWGLPERVP